MNDQDLADVFLDALDVLDKLVDPLLDIGICKGRVSIWKRMMRDIIVAERKSTRGRSPMVKKGEKLSEEHKRKIGEGVHRQSAYQEQARGETENPGFELGQQAMRMQVKLQQLEKYIGDLTFVAPEVFPDGQQVHHRVGQILEMWK